MPTAAAKPSGSVVWAKWSPSSSARRVPGRRATISRPSSGAMTWLLRARTNRAGQDVAVQSAQWSPWVAASEAMVSCGWNGRRQPPSAGCLSR
ncbi:hypothetical protein [Actinomadura montaniterrae]|uniref:Uncharacterized protein n=1 Tax=Actinomadura montaniterrae TaxID=1803903 RepID=A0A6L3W1L8_9ACTN|nr:hypothetical protein [Actinomadura montaniterrae]KAB2388055.1 hypothetical protein F9B16_05680 [Actinomadura montaniterrae]